MDKLIIVIEISQSGNLSVILKINRSFVGL